MSLSQRNMGKKFCAYYGNQDDVLSAPFESLSAGFMVNKAFSDLIWNTEFFYSTTKSTAYSTPAAINQLDDAEGPWVKEDALFIFDDAQGNNALLDAFVYRPIRYFFRPRTMGLPV